MELILPWYAFWASRTLRTVDGDSERSTRGWRAAVGQRAHSRRAAVRAQRVRARRQCRALRPRLRHLADAPATQACLLRRLGGSSRSLRVVNVPIVLHYGHHERHLGGGDGDSCALTFLVKYRLRRREKLRSLIADHESIVSQ